MTVGSYGTNEGVTTWWIDQWATGGVASGYYLFNSCPPAQPSAYSPPSYAVTAPGQWGVGGRCVPPKIEASGNWCPSSQPPYSRWREHAYGVGMLDLLSPTKAVWAFYSQESAMFKPVDEVVLSRADPVKCAATPETIAAAAATGVSLDAVVSKFNVTAAALAKLPPDTSPDCVAMLRRILTLDPPARPCLLDIMAEPWFRQFLPDLSKLNVSQPREQQSVQEITRILQVRSRCDGVAWRRGVGGGCGRGWGWGRGVGTVRIDRGGGCCFVGCRCGRVLPTTARLDPHRTAPTPPHHTAHRTGAGGGPGVQAAAAHPGCIRWRGDGRGRGVYGGG